MAKTHNRIGSCALCRSPNVPLCESHIISEFLYNLPTDERERNRLRLWSSDPEQHPKRCPVGVYERLLCRSCEDRFRDWENYVALVLYDTQGRVKVQGHDRGSHFEFAGVQYAPMKLFLLSMLWRMSVSTSRYFENVRLGEAEEHLRTMLLTNDPGLAADYGCVISYCPLLRERFPDLDLRQLGVFPEDAGSGFGYPMIRMVFGGLFWQYHITRQVKHSQLTQLMIDVDGVLRIPKLGENAFHFIGRAVEEVYDRRRGDATK